MVTLKSIINNIICFIGAVILALCLGELTCGGHFAAAKTSRALIVLTVIVVACLLIKCAAVFTKCGIKKDRHGIERYIVPAVIIAIAGAGMRFLTFIITELPLTSIAAAYMYIFAAVNTVLIFYIVRCIWTSASGIWASIIYALWGACEVLLLAKFAATPVKLVVFAGAITLALASVLAMFYSITTMQHGASLVLCCVSGIMAGIATALETVFALLVFCALVYYLMEKPVVREKAEWKDKARAISPISHFFLYLFSSILAFAAVTLVINRIGKITLFEAVKSFEFIKVESFFGFFAEADSSLSTAFSVASFPASAFANYIHLVMFAVIILLATAASVASAIRRDVKTTFLVMFPVLTVIYQILGGSSYPALILTVPFTVILAVYGMNSLGEFIAMFKWLYKGARQNPAFTERYILHCDEKRPLDETQETAETTEDNTAAEPEETFTEYVSNGEAVATGNTQDDLLSDLAKAASRNTISKK